MDVADEESNIDTDLQTVDIMLIKDSDVHDSQVMRVESILEAKNIQIHIIFLVRDVVICFLGPVPFFYPKFRRECH